jgi:hypothetical protein
MAGGAWTVGTTAAATVRSAVRRCKFSIAKIFSARIDRGLTILFNLKSF